MNPFIQKFVDDGFFNETVGNYIEEAINKDESIIIAGHRSAGTRNFMANLMAVTKKQYDTVQVKKPEDLEKDAKYYLIPGNPNVDFEDLIAKALKKPDSAIISIKEPEQPVSLMKILRGFAKEGEPSSKIIHQIECDKKDGVPFVAKVTAFSQNEDGKVAREDLQF
ncbi:MAG TPA: hypothetical protein DC038_06820 [Clostridiales bacterium]|nr:hypothetical protein [Clostridiales bacterium]